ncbi:ketopantoate reductase family protein [Saccharibacillus sacchari]|uniref:Ketopantoate reductase family protein n=1 Tax=Saccharibacillus sacchari TaxID=456493 RepID=A0ACC6PBF7_9BACL
MRVEVIGGGALGLLFAAAAAKGGAEVVLYTRTTEQANKIMDSGIQVNGPTEKEVWSIGSPAIIAAHAIDRFSEEKGQPRWIVLAVKQKHLDASLIARLQANVRAEDRLFCLQNGVGHIERLTEALPEVPVYAAVTTEGARRLDAAAVLHAGKGSTLFGRLAPAWPKPSAKQEQAEKMLVKALGLGGLSLAVSNEIEIAMYRKLLINAVINPLTALWKIENGALLEKEERIRFMRAVFDEIMTIYSAAGIEAPMTWWEELLSVCRATAHNRSSMLEDVSRGDRTEAAWISGGVVELANRSGKQAPVNQTLFYLIEGLNGWTSRI